MCYIVTYLSQVRRPLGRVVSRGCPFCTEAARGEQGEDRRAPLAVPLADSGMELSLESAAVPLSMPTTTSPALSW